MSFLEDLYKTRQKLAGVLSDPEYSGIREIVEELYPDRAHFIYELLQNAEDAGATTASFILEDNRLRFAHNGRPFTEADVNGITNIGKGTKRDQEDQIGRFGVGFKAVFAYTETPHIWSPTFSFKITELVLPTAIDTDASIGQKTHFEFPFSNPKKSTQDAFTEVKSGLEELAETTLLFLTNLESIRWRIGPQMEGEVLRIQHSEHHIEVLKQIGGKTTTSSHFLRFSAVVEGLEKQRVAIAFALGYLPNITLFDSKKALAKQLKIVPANPGRVAVFFPADKETSGLRFHLHAPFVPELSRASIKETPANGPLFRQLARLAATSLHSIRDLQLLTGEFLGVLPNSQDPIPPRYEPIRSAIIAEMDNKPLTPTHTKSHAPAKHLFQSKASLKELLSADDLASLIGSDDEPLQWAIGAPQKNSNNDRFLASLAITDWDTDAFVKLLIDKTAEKFRRISAVPDYATCVDKEFMGWLAGKPVEWHQQLYSLLYKELEPHGFYRLKNLYLVRLCDGSYSVGGKCYFPNSEVDQSDTFPLVDQNIYTVGRSKPQQEEARKFLEKVGVREIGETEQVEEILKQRYTKDTEFPDDRTYIKDLKRFMAMMEKEPDKAKMFAEFYIFKQANGRGAIPKQVFLDSPILETGTGLGAYYSAMGKDAVKFPLSSWYHSVRGVPLNKLSAFAQAVGVEKELQLVEVSCSSNAKKDYLYGASGYRVTNSQIDRDYYLLLLHKVIDAKDVGVSRVIWQAMCRNSAGKLEAQFRWNRSHEARRAPSLVINWLESRAWVPQTNGEFVKPSQASKELLPTGFPTDKGYKWLEAVSFGEEVQLRSEARIRRQNLARELGFVDDKTLADAQWFAGIDLEERKRLRDEFEARQEVELPEDAPRNPDRRSERVGEEAGDAMERMTEKRLRSVSVGREVVKQEADQYLRRQYTNPDGETFCQICEQPLPFKLDDGRYYFEAVEFLSELKKRHYQNYLDLCPNHSAMFQHVNHTQDLMKEMFEGLGEGETRLEVVLAGVELTVYFTETHIADLKAVVSADADSDNEDEDD